MTYRSEHASSLGRRALLRGAMAAAVLTAPVTAQAQSPPSAGGVARSIGSMGNGGLSRARLGAYQAIDD